MLERACGDCTSAMPQLEMVCSGRREGRDRGRGRGRGAVGGTDLNGLSARSPPLLEGVRGVEEEDIDTARNVSKVITSIILYVNAFS